MQPTEVWSAPSPGQRGESARSPTRFVHRPDEADEQHSLRHQQQVGLPGTPPAGRGRVWWCEPREDVGSSRHLGQAIAQVVRRHTHSMRAHSPRCVQALPPSTPAPRTAPTSPALPDGEVLASQRRQLLPLQGRPGGQLRALADLQGGCLLASHPRLAGRLRSGLRDCTCAWAAAPTVSDSAAAGCIGVHLIHCVLPSPAAPAVCCRACRWWEVAGPPPHRLWHSYPPWP